MENTNPTAKVKQLYALFIAGIILSFVPNAASLLGCLLVIIMLVSAYKTRKNNRDDAFISSHTNFIIRQFWIASTIMLVTFIIACFYIFAEFNFAPMEPCLGGINPDMLNMSPADQAASMNNMMSSCIDPFVQANKPVLIISGLIAFGPFFFYIVARYVRGFLLAAKSQLAPNKKSA